jgi:hypothetical protein
MGIGTGVVLLVIGLILVTRAITLPASWQAHINEHALGWIFIILGIVSLVASLMWIGAARRRGITYIDRGDPPL